MRIVYTVILASSVTGCAAVLACTEIGCQGELAVAIDGVLDGVVEVEIEDDDGVVACTFDTATDAPPSCEGATLEPTDAGFVITRELGMDQQPEEVTVRVFEDGEVVLEETFAPEWGEPFYPNGEACGGACSSAEASFTV